MRRGDRCAAMRISTVRSRRRFAFSSSRWYFGGRPGIPSGNSALRTGIGPRPPPLLVHVLVHEKEALRQRGRASTGLPAHCPERTGVHSKHTPGITLSVIPEMWCNFLHSSYMSVKKNYGHRIHDVVFVPTRIANRSFRDAPRSALQASDRVTSASSRFFQPRHRVGGTHGREHGVAIPHVSDTHQ